MMEIDVPTASMIRCEVEDDVDALNRLPSGVLVEEIALRELDAIGDERLEVDQPAAGEIVDDTERGHSANEALDQVRADERRASGDEHPLV